MFERNYKTVRDSYKTLNGETSYPELTPEALSFLSAVLESNLIREEVLQVMVHDKKKLLLDKEVTPAPLDYHQVGLLIARMQANHAGEKVNEVLRAIVPDYRAKVNHLCYQSEENASFYPTIYNDFKDGWGVATKVLFRRSDEVKPEELNQKLRQVYCHPLKYIPPFINELGLFYDTNKEDMPFPVFTPYPQKNSSMWYGVFQRNEIPQEDSSLTRNNILQAGTYFAGMCEQEFFTAPLNGRS